MPSLIIQIDSSTLASLRRIAPGGKEQQALFIRQAVKDAIRKREYDQIRQAYLLTPDSANDADNWSNAEEWNYSIR